MECWSPLFDIFLNSPCPESEASIWLMKSFNPLSNTTSISTSSFLSLLMKPLDVSLPVSSTLTEEISVMWIQTLPDVVQARILSFLAYDYRSFCYKDLCKIARVMLSESKDLDFWVKRGAEKLLDLVSVSNYRWLSHLNLDSEELNVEDEFQLVPDWLRDIANDSEPLFSWLPVSSGEITLQTPFSVCENGDDDAEKEEKKQVDFDGFTEKSDVWELEMTINDTLDTEVESLAESLKERILNTENAAKVVVMAEEMFKLCVENKGNSLTVLQLIEPWNADDEIAAVLISKLSNVKEVDELDLPSHILCSIVLPKYLILNEPSSRVLMNAAIEYCKTRQRSAAHALVLPLMLRAEGINNHLCDLITRIVKECLHPAHVSALCQKLLGKHEEAREIICLPCHKCLISDELVWTESLFSLLQNILNHNVYFTRDSVDQLVIRVCEFAESDNAFMPIGLILQGLESKTLVSKLGFHVKI